MCAASRAICAGRPAVTCFYCDDDGKGGGRAGELLVGCESAEFGGVCVGRYI